MFIHKLLRVSSFLGIIIEEGKELLQKVYKIQKRETLKRLKQLKDHQVFYIMDVNGKYISCNKHFIKVFGYPEHEVKEISFLDIVIPDDLMQVIHNFEQSKKGKVVSYRCIIKRKDGTSIGISVVNVPKYKNGVIVGIYGFAKIIKGFRNSKGTTFFDDNDLYIHTLNHSPDGVLIVQHETIVFVNEVAVKMFGAAKKEELLGQHIFKLLHPKYIDRAKDRYKQVLAGEPVDTMEEQYWKLDGSKLYVDVTSHPTFYRNDIAAQVILKDATQRRLANQLMIQAAKNSTASQFAAGIAHEIRNPMTAIKGFIQLIDKSKFDTPEYFDVINGEISRIEGILTELLSLAKPETDIFREANLIDLIHHVVILTKTQASIHNIAIEFDPYIENIPYYCDANKIKQVLINLIKNAIESMKNGGRIEVEITLVENMWNIIIADEGTGIPPEVLNNIGKPFVTTKESGTGLGMMVCLEILKQHNGKLTFNTGPNGTTSIIQLPFIK